MPKVYMFPNPKFGKPTAGGGPPNQSAKMADDVVAHLPGVKAHLSATARTIAARASGRLMTVKMMSSRSQGAMGSRIVVSQGVIDSYVSLDDTRSDGAAWQIEATHGVLKSALPRGRASLARPNGFAIGAKFPDRKPPKGLVINLDPLA